MKTQLPYPYRLYLLAVACCFLTFAGCKKDGEHYVRFRNNYKEALVVAKLDGINFGRVEPGSTTDYKYVFPGTFNVTIETESGLKGEGSAKLTGGSGRQNWVIIVNSKGYVYGESDM